MTKKTIWRLAKLPTPDEVRELVKDSIITKDEARDILIGSGEDIKSLKEEIEFLRKLVDNLSNQLSISRTQIVETIKYVEKPYYRYDWYQPYKVWCSTGNAMSATFQSVGSNYSDGTTAIAN